MVYILQLQLILHFNQQPVLLRRLNTIQSIGSFLRTKNGYRVTNPEVYVAIAKATLLN